ncbi:prepilin-type N-terminal cleavage/methylation domain-containing protein [Gammaproteobacteria bacterium AS21]
MRQPITTSKQRGFTLIELILVIVIMSIIALGSTIFIVNSAKGLHETQQRAAQANQLRTNIDKISYQLNHSINASVRVKRNNTSQCLEMMPIRAKALYISSADGASNKLTTVFLNNNVIGMRAVPAMSLSSSFYASLLAQDNAVISANIIEATNSDASSTTLTLAAPSLADALAKPGENKRRLLYFIDSPISYCIEAGKLYRYSHYKASSKQKLADKLPSQEPKKILLAKGLNAHSAFSYQAPTKTVSLVLSTGLAPQQLTLNQPLRLSND